MDNIKTKMRSEIEDIPHAIQRLLDNSQSSIKLAAKEMNKKDPSLICTVARGSSDHAATYLKYAFELVAHLPVASIGPSVSSIYGTQLKMDNSVCLGISQSGKSPDIQSMMVSSREGGALTIGITNDAHSPLAQACKHTIDIQAGREESVAATKTFVTSIVSGLLLLAHWKDDQPLLRALNTLPEQAAKAIECDWSSLSQQLIGAEALYVLGRGPSFAIANEVALKFKETCQIQGEAFSSAEVLHGPLAIISPDYPVLSLIARDKSEASISGISDNIAQRGGKVFASSKMVELSNKLPFASSAYPLTDPLLLIVSFYAFVEELSRLRGFDPDKPRHLKKVTQTV